MTACFKAFSVSVVGFWENACAALVALAALDTTPPTIPGEEELCTALELAGDEPRVTELGVDADEDAVNEVVACDALVKKGVEDADVETTEFALLDGRLGVLSIDDGSTELDEGTLEEEAALLDVIGTIEGVLDTPLLLNVAVAVQNSCGTTL